MTAEPHPSMHQLVQRIDWRERDSTTLADLYDGDWHLVNMHSETGEPGWRPLRQLVRAPHPLKGVRYADGVV